jgi:hypothetical protein
MMRGRRPSETAIMHVNPTLAQGLQVLTAFSSDEATPPKAGSATVDLVKTANGISTKTSNPVKQASAAIGNALLGMTEQSSPRSDEVLREAARQKAFANGSSWGVEQYDSIDDMPHDMREVAAKNLARHEEEMTKLATVPGTHNWNSQVAHHLSELMRYENKGILNYWSYDAKGSAKVPAERAAEMHPAELREIQTFERNLKAGVSAINDNADVTGDIFVKNDDGTWSWGVFEVRDRDTGTLYFNHDGSGKVKFHDKGIVFSEVDTVTGGNWTRFDRATYDEVFGPNS